MRNRLVRLISFASALAALPALGRGQERTVIPLLTSSDWRLVRSQTGRLDAVRDWGGDPTIEREYGVRTLELRTYRTGEKAAEVVVEEAADPSAAYGLLTFYQSEGMTPAKGMELTLVGQGGALLARGRYFVRARPALGSTVSAEQFRSLLLQLGDHQPPPSELARVPAPLPSKGLLPRSERYLLGPEAARRVLPQFRTELLGFSQGAEVQLGNYQTGGGPATLLAINYPTPQIARTRFGAMESFLEINRERGADSIYGQRRGSFVLLVLGLESATAASNLLAQFQITSDVSWNERVPDTRAFTLRVIELVLANIFLSFIIAGLAVSAGIMFFFGRRLARIWFPQWEWADPDRETIIRLKLS